MRSVRELLLILPTAATLGVLLVGAIGENSAKQAACADNLRQLVRCADRYSADHDGYIVPTYVQPPNNKTWIYWAGSLQEYMDDFACLYCPADARKNGVSKHDLLPTGFAMRCVSYGINRSLAGETSPKQPVPVRKRSQVTDPSYLIYFGDAKVYQLRPTRGCWLRDWNPVHDGGANYAMVDGHVEYFNGHNPGICDRIPDWPKDRKRWIDWK